VVEMADDPNNDERTVVSPDVFEALNASLDEPAERNEALAAAARRRRGEVRWEGGPVSFDDSHGGEILDWSETVSAHRSEPRISRNVAALLGIPLDDPDVEQNDDLK
jgi:hypothetical protein